MKRWKALGVLTLLAATLLTAAPGSHAATTRAPAPHKNLSVLLYIDGALGDLGFFDSANAGVQRAHNNLGVDIKVIQQGDSTQYQSQILTLAGSHKYDLIILDSTDPVMNTAT